MKVFVQFLIVAIDRPLPDLYDANVWAATRRQALRDGLDLL
jgi:hypothetical protein